MGLDEKTLLTTFTFFLCGAAWIVLGVLAKVLRQELCHYQIQPKWIKILYKTPIVWLGLISWVWILLALIWLEKASPFIQEYKKKKKEGWDLPDNSKYKQDDPKKEESATAWIRFN